VRRLLPIALGLAIPGRARALEFVGVGAEWPVAWAPHVAVFETTTMTDTWGTYPVTSRVPTADVTRYGGFWIEVSPRTYERDIERAGPYRWDGYGWKRMPGTTHVREGMLVLTGGMRSWAGTFRSDAAYGASITELTLDVGARRVPTVAADGLMRPYVYVGGGIAVTVFDSSDYFPTWINPAPHVAVAAGELVGTGRVQVAVEGRAALLVRVDSYDGHVETVPTPLDWTYWPGGASISVGARVELHPEARDSEP
jgi:hypothetical protein